MENYFIFFGDDIRGNPAEILGSVTADGCLLLPLDIDAIAFAMEYGYRYLSLEDFFKSRELIKTRKLARRYSTEWYEKEREGFSSRGICWPEFDLMALYFFWYDSMIILELVDILKRRDARVFIMPLYDDLRPALYIQPSGTAKTLLKALLGDYLRELYFDGEPTGKRTPSSPVYFPYPGPPEEMKRRLSDRIFFVTPVNEYFRARDIIAVLRKDFGDRLVFGGTHPPNMRTREYSREFDCHIVSVPHPLPVEPDLENRFMEAYRKSVSHASGTPYYEILRRLVFHFSHYLTERWPKQDGMYRYWLELFRNYPPAAVIVGNVELVDFQLPAEAADVLGIPSFSIPHGAVGRSLLELQPASRVLCNSRMSKQLIEKDYGKSNHKKLIVAAGLILKNEIRYDDELVFHHQKDRTNILVLVDNFSFKGLAMPFIRAKAHIESLSATAAIPESLPGRIHLLVKTHPSGHDRLFYKHLPISKFWLPLKLKLEDVLDKTDLVLAPNYYGSALVHVVLEGKPIIFLNTDPTYRDWEMFPQIEMMTAAGEVTTNAVEYRDAVKRFIEDDDYAETLKEKSRTFAREYWDDSGYETVSQIIAREIGVEQEAMKK